MYIFGASALGEIVVDVALRSGYAIEGFYDDINQNEKCNGVPILGTFANLISNNDVREKGVFVAIGDNGKRKAIAEKLINLEIAVKNIIDRTAVIESSAVLGEGNLIMANTYIGTKTVLGDGNLIFPGVSITHHNVVGDFCFFSPNASVGGFSKIESESKISMNCVVLPYRLLGAKTDSAPGSVIEGRKAADGLQ